MAFAGVVMASFLSWAEFAGKGVFTRSGPRPPRLLPGTGEVRQELAEQREEASPRALENSRHDLLTDI